MYDLGDRLLMVASDRISTYDVVHPNRDPGQGQGPDRPLGVLVRQDRAHRAQPLHLGDRRRARTRSAAARWPSRKLKMLPVECVVRGYITGSGWKDYQATGKVSGIELPPGLRESEKLPTPIFTPSTKAEEGHDEAIDFDAGRRDPRRPRAAGAAARRLDRAVLLRRRPRRRARRDPRRHEVRVRPRRRRRADPRRRGADARLLALLARRRLRARPRPAELRQAVRARLGVGHRLGQGAARARGPRRRRRRHARALRRGLRADHRRAVRRLARAGPRHEGPRADPAQGRDPRPAGRRRRARAAGARLRAASPTSTSAGSSSSTSRTRRSSTTCARSCWPTR